MIGQCKSECPISTIAADTIASLSKALTRTSTAAGKYSPRTSLVVLSSATAAEMNGSWAPNETADVINQEKIILQANILENIPYGVELTLFVMCSIALFQNMNSSNFKRQCFLFTLIVVVFGTGTIFMITNSLLTQQAFVEYRAYPGGPSAFIEAMFSDTAGFTNSISWVVSNCTLDAFLVSSSEHYCLSYSIAYIGVEIFCYIQGCQSFLASHRHCHSLCRCVDFHW